jgi:hypothetical protein
MCSRQVAPALLEAAAVPPPLPPTDAEKSKKETEEKNGTATDPPLAPLPLVRRFLKDETFAIFVIIDGCH